MRAGMYIFILCFNEQLVGCLACFGRSLCDGRIADGDDDSGFFCLGHLEELVAALGIEVTNPAGAKPLFCGGEAKMLHRDGNIDIAVRLAVSPHPFLLM